MDQVTSRTAAVRELAQNQNSRLISYYLTFGAFDFVSVLETPDAETAARLVLAIGAQGNVRTTTMLAFTEDETAAITSSMP